MNSNNPTIPDRAANIAGATRWTKKEISLLSICKNIQIFYYWNKFFLRSDPWKFYVRLPLTVKVRNHHLTSRTAYAITAAIQTTTHSAGNITFIASLNLCLCDICTQKYGNELTCGLVLFLRKGLINLGGQKFSTKVTWQPSWIPRRVTRGKH